MYESIKALGIRTSLVLNLSFPYNIFLLSFFVFFFIIDLYLLVLAVTAQMFVTITEHVIPTGRQKNETNAEIETQPGSCEDTISKFSTKVKHLCVFFYLSLIKSLYFISSKR